LAATILAHAEAAKNIKTAAAENKSNILQHSASCAFFHAKKAGNQFFLPCPFLEMLLSLSWCRDRAFTSALHRNCF
jgi:hypothetical protein